ncbi:hypothetical protein GGR57DRAFT_410245 [Xylariaceae sp. FL1272]|nr:hypothetical protein GGR57DRAFT_410245 [Xylariaceae sp. FL1272]
MWEKERKEIEDMERKERIEAEKKAERAIAEAAAAERERDAQEAARVKYEEECERERKRVTEQKLEAENELRMRAEKKVLEEAMLASRAEDERRDAEAELRQRDEAEAMARKAKEERKAEEESIRKWAAERAEKDLESKNQIHFKDALGRRFAVPYSQGRTWQGMEELIHEAFRHVEVVGPEVLAGHYDLMGPEDTIILPSTWDKIVQPGWNISMSMWPMVEPAAALQPMPAPPQPLGGPIPRLSPPLPPFTNPPHMPQVNENHASIPLDPTETSMPRISGASDDNDALSEGYSFASSDEVITFSRRRRIANAFSSLKSAVFRRRRRGSVTTTESSVSEELVDD